MAKPILGEASLKLSTGPVDLRLDIGTMMDLEDHFGTGTLNIVSQVLPRMRARDVALIHLAMTGREWRDKEVVDATAKGLIGEGIGTVATAQSQCFTNTLLAAATGSKKKPLEAVR